MIRTAVAALAALALATPQRALQNVPDGRVGRQERVVYAERVAAFWTAWDRAPRELREDVRGLVERALGAGAPAGAWPGARELGLGLRVLRGAPIELALEELEEPRLDTLADALDLMVVSGVGTAGVERGEPMTVRVWPHDEAAAGLARQNVELALYWVMPDGRETRARLQDVSSSALRRPGFDLFVRSPAEGEGPWRLVPEVRADGSSSRGPGIVVHTVEGYPERFNAAYDRVAGVLSGAAEGELHESVAGLFDDLWMLWNTGARMAPGRDPARELELFEELAAGGVPLRDRLRARLLPIEGVSLYELPVGYEYEGPEGAASTLLILNPSRLPADSLLDPPRGHAWRRLAHEHGVRLVTADWDASGGHSPAELVGALRRLRPDEPLGICARGDAFRHLVWAALQGEELALDYAVLVGDVPRPSPALPEVPTLLFTTVEDAPSDERVQVVQIAGASFFAEPDLPHRIGAWLFERGVPAASDG